MGRDLNGPCDPMQRTPMGEPLVLGLLGGIASGKSMVAAGFARLGARVLDADQCVAELFAEEAVRQSLTNLFGPAVLDAAGVNRKLLAEIVFAPGGEEALKNLEALLHPRVERSLTEDLAACLAEPGAPELVLLDVPLLAESPRLLSLCNRLVFVDATEEAREQRCRESRKWSAGERARRERLQMPLEEKRALCRHTIANSGSVADIEAAVRELHSGVLAAHRLAAELARHGPNAHGGLGPEARARDGARRDGNGSSSAGRAQR